MISDPTAQTRPEVRRSTCKSRGRRLFFIRFVPRLSSMCERGWNVWNKAYLVSAHTSAESMLSTITGLDLRSFTLCPYEDLTLYLADGQTGLSEDVRVYLINRAAPRQRAQLLVYHENSRSKYRLFTRQICPRCSICSESMNMKCWRPWLSLSTITLLHFMDSFARCILHGKNRLQIFL